MNEDMVPRPRLGIGGRLGDLWQAFMLRGALAGILGLCALFWPSLSLAILIALVGLFCLADGLAGLVGAWRAGERGAHLLQAVLAIAVGALLLFWPGGSIRVLLILFGIWAAFTGASQIVAARRAELPDGERSPLSAVGVAALILGLILIFWPGSGVVAISWVIAFVALLVAALLIFVALRLKRLQARLRVSR